MTEGVLCTLYTLQSNNVSTTGLYHRSLPLTAILPPPEMNTNIFVTYVYFYLILSCAGENSQKMKFFCFVLDLCPFSIFQPFLTHRGQPFSDAGFRTRTFLTYVQSGRLYHHQKSLHPSNRCRPSFLQTI